MKIAVLSGKGGTGKTTVSASMATSLDKCQYIDCDVEEPNGAIFLKPQIKNTYNVEVNVPRVDKMKCTGCGDCAKACQFNAIAVVKDNVLVFSEICHHCGSCVIACKPKAIYEVKRSIGVIESNRDNTFIQGKLNVGEPISIPIIKNIGNMLKDDMPVIIDCPPGASCSVVESIEKSDFCIIVTEPTPFGLHDLSIAVKLVRKMNIPFGVLINKAAPDTDIIHNYCNKEGIKILMEIPFSKEFAKGYSNGVLPVETNITLKNKFIELFDTIDRGVMDETGCIC